MHYYCGTCDSRVEGKLEVQDVIECPQCNRYYTMAELIILDVVYLYTFLRKWRKDERRIIKNRRENT